MTKPEIAQVVEQFAQGARRAREAGLDGVELHGANGYLLTQFLSSGINDRTDEYGGNWEGRAQFVLEISPRHPPRSGARFPSADEDQRRRPQRLALSVDFKGQHARRDYQDLRACCSTAARGRRISRLQRIDIPASAQPRRATCRSGARALVRRNALARHPDAIQLRGSSPIRSARGCLPTLIGACGGER